MGYIRANLLLMYGGFLGLRRMSDDSFARHFRILVLSSEPVTYDASANLHVRDEIHESS